MAAINGAMPALAKATSLLVDEGRLGAGLGIDSAVYAIDKAIELARGRMQRWLQRVSRLSQQATVDQIEKSFPGIRDRVLRSKDADELLKWPERLRDFRKREAPRVTSSGHIEIGIVIGADGEARILEPAVIAP